MRGRPRTPRELERRFWGGVRDGLSVEDAGRLAGLSLKWARRIFREAGGVNPTTVAAPVGRYLSFSEREEIAALVDSAPWSGGVWGDGAAS